MSRLSISRAWDETKATLASDGRLIMTVALALVAVPSAVATLISPNSGMAERSDSLAAGLVVFVMSLIAMVGQLAIIRLAIGPSVSVGEAIGHAARRTLPYLGSILLMIIGLVIVAIPMVVLLAVLGVSFEGDPAPLPGAAWIVIILFFALFFYLVVRLLLSSCVASAESVGPVGILRRSWTLTDGQAARLIGFLLMFLVAVIVVLGAVGLMVGLLARSLLGELEPLSAAALVVGLVQGVSSALATAVFAVMLARIYVQLSGGPAGAPEVTVPHSGS